MIIRHAEKHYEGSRDRGVCVDGFHTKHELTVRGWQRAGALVGFFAPARGLEPGDAISTPRAIFASAATSKSPSLRAQRTVEPLAAALGVQIDHRHSDGEEHALADAILAAPGPVLVSWHHSHIIRLAHIIAGHDVGCPAEWPEDRFDVVWVLDQASAGGGWTFSQVAQRIFAHDRPEAI